MDASGKVVGIVDLGTVEIDSQSLQRIETTYKLLMPVSVLKDLLNKINIHPQESITTKMYKQALTELEQQDYSRALNTLQQLDKIIPGNSDIGNYIKQATTILSSEAHQKTTTISATAATTKSNQL